MRMCAYRQKVKACVGKGSKRANITASLRVLPIAGQLNSLWLKLLVTWHELMLKWTRGRPVCAQAELSCTEHPSRIDTWPLSVIVLPKVVLDLSWLQDCRQTNTDNCCCCRCCICQQLNEKQTGFSTASRKNGIYWKMSRKEKLNWNTGRTSVCVWRLFFNFSWLDDQCEGQTTWIVVKVSE